MKNLTSEQLNTHMLANAFNMAISSATIGLSTLIVYNNKDLAMDLSSIIHRYRKGHIHFINMHRFNNPDVLRAYLFNETSDAGAFMGIPDSGTLVFENVDLISKEFQQILRAFYDHNEREKLGFKLIYLSRSTLEEERARGDYDAPLYYRISGAVIDCRLIQSEIN